MDPPGFPIPAPVGGHPNGIDFAPSILWAVLYLFLLPVGFYRCCDKQSRTALLGGSISMAVERIIIFSLRATASRTPSDSTNKGLADYMQLTIGLGYMALGQDLIGLLRCLLVNSTNGPESSSPCHVTLANLTPLSSPPPLFESPETQLKDKPTERRLYRRSTDLAAIVGIASMVTGGIANGQIGAGIEDQAKGKMTMKLRYASSAISFCLIFGVGWIALWTRFKRPRVRQKPAMLLAALSFLLVKSLFLVYDVPSLIVVTQSVVPLYRLTVMYHTTPSLSSTAPGSLNSPMEKAGFYVFHVAPEWILPAVILGTRTREIFDTGPCGDYRMRDELPEERKNRQLKHQLKLEKASQKRRCFSWC